MSAAPKRPLTQDEIEAIHCLSLVGFVPASWDKRFNRDVLQPARETKELSDKAVAQLWRLLLRYRRQWSHPEKRRLLSYAEDHGAPDFRKQQAADRAQRRIDEMKEKYERSFQSQ